MAGISAASQGGKKTLYVYNAGEYIDPDLLTQFENEYNCSVIYDTFESNEMMYTKLSSGERYDVLVPSDYMIERLIREEYLAPIQWDLITNKDKLMDEVMDKSYDPGNVYSVPYFWGTVGILYDTTVVSEEDMAAGWDVLMNPKYRGNLYMYDSERDSFMVALKALGYSMNTHDEEQIREAYEWLITQRDSMDPVYAGDDVIDNMISGNKALAIVYSGDASYIMSENENMSYCTPSQGTNLWYDAMVITKNCQETELAHAFIDFMLRDDVALANTEYVGYTSVVSSAYEAMQETTYAGSMPMYRIYPTVKTRFLLIRIQRSSGSLPSCGQRLKHNIIICRFACRGFFTGLRHGPCRRRYGRTIRTKQRHKNTIDSGQLKNTPFPCGGPAQDHGDHCHGRGLYEENHIDQWSENYPDRGRFLQDIEKNESYICQIGGCIAATAALSLRDESNYEKIFEGRWKTSGPYGVIHRIAVDDRFKGTGVAAAFVDHIEKCV